MAIKLFCETKNMSSFMFCSAGVVIAITFAVVVLLLLVFVAIFKVVRRKSNLKNGMQLSLIDLKTVSNIH